MDVKVVHGAVADHHLCLIRKPLLRPWVLQLLPLHMLVQLGVKEGPSNVQQFIAHHPPTFTGGGDPMVALVLFAKKKDKTLRWCIDY